MPVPAPATWSGSDGSSLSSFWGGSDDVEIAPFWGAWNDDSWGSDVEDDYSWGKSGKSGWVGLGSKSSKSGWGGSGKSGKVGGWGGWNGKSDKSGSEGLGKSGKAGEWGGWGGKSNKSGWGGSGKSGKAAGWGEYPNLLLPLDESSAVSDQFLVILDQDCTNVAGMMRDLVRAVNSVCPGPEAKPLCEPWNIHNEFKGQLVRMTLTHARAMSSMVGVQYIEQDQYLEGDYPTIDEKVHRLVQRDQLSWGLDRIDQKEGPIDGMYNYDYTGKGVTAYVIDSGIDRNHEEFQGRILLREDFTNSIPIENCLIGGDHGTHVAGTIGGTTYGVAKEVNFVDVRVFTCDRKTQGSFLVRAYIFVAKDFKERGGPAVANASLGAMGQAIDCSAK